MEFKTVTVETQVNAEKREVVAYASVFDVRDRVGDVVRPGAFSKTLSKGLDRVAYKYNHDILIGRPVSAVEDSKGLLTTARVSNTPAGNDALELMRDGSLSTYSFKYATVKGKTDMGNDGERNLRELKLFEFGPVDPDLACNPETLIVSVKGGEFCSVWDYIDALGSYLRGLEAKDRLTPEEITLLQRAYEGITGTSAKMKSLLESGEATSMLKPGAATQSKESAGDSISPLAVLALAAAVRERATIAHRNR